MTILYVTDAFAVWGGMERVLADKMIYLTEQYDYEVYLLTINQGNHPLTYGLHPAITHIDLGVQMHKQYLYRGVSRFLKRYELMQILKVRLKDVISELRPRIIICLKLDFVNILLKLNGKTPLVVESHTLCKSEKYDRVGRLRRMYVWFLKRRIKKAEAVVALTEGDAADWRIINNNVYVIPNVVHLNVGGSSASYNQKSVIFVGRFSQQKDIDSLLQIWLMVHQKHEDWHLDIYGEGELMNHFLPVISAMNANVYVHEPTADIMEKYKNSSILVLTSLYEPFGLVLPEAMSCGLPVVAFDCPYGPADIITDGVDGFLIKNRNIEVFANKVCQLIENLDLRIKMGKAGIKSSKKYSVKRIMPQWDHFFNQLLK
jgi:glycosyltransferase involved in cell wall biosynthesis